MTFVLLALACAVGLVLLARAAEVFVVASAALAKRFGVSTVTVGVVVVGFGTSAPELLVSALAAGAGAADIGIGNIVGSNIANLTLVLGVGALVAPLVVAATVVRREALVATAATAVFAAVLVGGGLSRLDGVLLLVVMAASLLLMLRWARVPAGGSDELAAEVEEFLAEEARGSTTREVLRTVAGLVGTLGGAQLLVVGATGIAERTGLSGGFVGLTVVAVGTSLPELVTAAQAARRGESDLIVGNLLGSNIFNALAVGGVVGVLAPDAPVGAGLRTWGTGLAVAVSILAVLLMRRRLAVTRFDGALLVAGYAAVLPALAVVSG